MGWLVGWFWVAVHEWAGVAVRWLILRNMRFLVVRAGWPGLGSSNDNSAISGLSFEEGEKPIRRTVRLLVGWARQAGRWAGNSSNDNYLLSLEEFFFWPLDDQG